MDISFQETGVVKQKEDIIIRRGIVQFWTRRSGIRSIRSRNWI